jgi:RNA polymerase sigma factor (sigma-70 family)
MNVSIVTLDDKTLIEMVVAGHRECFSVLMDRHVGAVRNYLRALVRNPSDLEDVVQNTFMKGWFGLSTFRFQANFRTWLMSVAWNEALILYRRSKSRPSCPVMVDLETFPSKSESPHQAFTRSETRFRIRTAVQRLPRKYRDVVVLCDLEELTLRETATQLNASLSLVKTRLFRARRMLSAAMNEQAA